MLHSEQYHATARYSNADVQWLQEGLPQQVTASCMSICIFIAGMLLVDTQMKTLRRPAALSDFLQCQEGHLGDVVDALRSDWLLKVIPLLLTPASAVLEKRPILCAHTVISTTAFMLLHAG